ncbi:hypothetical protein [uncultured Campylobacter sp.]|uniref:hypothetical protein n=1 Tax=uncultured Campylobacter sp. TaxID=218934 RepID=UPI0026174C9F|nr:hypothetical protein [uncultured Campylobacter sp.]
MHYEILNLAAMSSQTRERLGLKSCAQFLRGILRAKFQMLNLHGFRAEFCVEFYAEFNEISRDEIGAPNNLNNPNNQNSTG